MKEINISIKNFSKAVTKLTEGIRQADDELARDGVIQRFEFIFERLWKTLKLILNHEGFKCVSPRSCIKEAFRRDLILDDAIYLDMLEDRNKSSYIYDEETSIEIFTRIKTSYLPKLKEALKKFEAYIATQ